MKMISHIFFEICSRLSKLRDGASQLVISTIFMSWTSLFSLQVWAAAPTAIDDFAQISATGDVINVLQNDIGQIDPATLLIAVPAANGIASPLGNPGLEEFVGYLPNSGFCGQDSFSYTVEDGQGNVSNEGIVTVEVVCQTAVITSDTSVLEGDSGANTVIFNFQLTYPVNSPSGLELIVSTVDGTATALDGDYVSLSTTINIPDGAVSASFSVDILADNISDDAEYFFVEFASADSNFVTSQTQIDIRELPLFNADPKNPLIKNQFGIAEPLLDTNRYTIVHFCAIWCVACQNFTQNVLPDLMLELDNSIGANAYTLREVVIQNSFAAVSDASDAQIWAQAYFADPQQPVGHMDNNDFLMNHLVNEYSIGFYPTILVIDSDGHEISRGATFDPSDLVVLTSVEVVTLPYSFAILLGGLFVASVLIRNR